MRPLRILREILLVAVWVLVALELAFWLWMLFRMLTE